MVDGESMWVYDPDEGRWMYGDGRRLHTYAAERPATGGTQPDHAPTRYAAPGGES
ncbi:hypothetical protein [Streptomyces sp. NPDC059168]|uniref:hypothetical protein n=1 Tax=Streptomyces sp. NPDC059168 TaxID=3346753 RepID=UPI0036B68DEA